MRATRGSLRSRPVRWRWRWLCDSPLVLATWATVLLGAWSMQRAGSALHSAEHVRVGADAELARLAADTAVMQLPASTRSRGLWQRSVGSVRVKVERRGDELIVVSALPDGPRHVFTGRVLPGAMPDAFGTARSTDVPALSSAALAAAAAVEQAPVIRRDGGVALMQLESGTDLRDFVLDDGELGGGGVANGVVEVPGHLWIEPGRRPLVLRCRRDVTVVVRGNLYVGRSVELVGPGRVVFVTLGSESARPFADLDGNGRRSDGEGDGGGGAVEGGGNVYFGLAESPRRLELAAGVVAGGRVHLLREVRVDGPFVAADEPVVIDPAARVLATGRRLFRPGRELVPGFAAAGPPRPGLLTAAPGP